MRDGFVKAAAATPDIRTGDCGHNARAILELLGELGKAGVKVAVLPELCLTGYTCGDLFLQPTLLRGAERTLSDILAATAELDMLFALGLPIPRGGALYNGAAVCCRGELLGLVPKAKLPNYGEFYELRHFRPGPEGPALRMPFAGQETFFGRELVFCCASMPNLRVGVEICEDLWAPGSPSERLCAAGASLILNLSASDELVGKADYRRSLVKAQSAKLVCAYLYADAGQGESTTDMVFSGHDLIAENGSLLGESLPFAQGRSITEVDVDYLTGERRRMNTYPAPLAFGEVPFLLKLEECSLSRPIPAYPFVPAGDGALASRCGEILVLQAAGLCGRLRATGIQRAVIGVSGGLDSTLALLVTARAFDSLGLPRSGISALTMPGFGTTGRTKGNAERLCQALGVPCRRIDIQEAAAGHLRDIGHPLTQYDTAYENAQARERTQILMDIANMENGLVIGTGDLSELALGYATYNGDHMSMYGVNASVPKTLVRHLVQSLTDTADSALLRDTLLDILDTAVSPELLPPRDGEIAQRTEDILGPYALHDFFLYCALRRCYPPAKIYRLARLAFADEFAPDTILSWLKSFYRRFFAQQFKRSCLPDGPKIGSLSLSPRADWRMPSDASAALWRRELADL